MHKRGAIARPLNWGWGIECDAINWSAVRFINAVTVTVDQAISATPTVSIPVAGDSRAEAVVTAVIADAAVVPIPLTAFTDRFDFGDAASEKDHSVATSPSSGTSMEGGDTRRYSGVASPNSYVEFTGKVTSERAVIFRAIETYDWAQTKDYVITVNGTKVANRF